MLILPRRKVPGIPKGLIIPLKDVSIPEGWSVFSSADGKLIVGAGSTYNVADIGGSISIAGSRNTSIDGDHNPGFLTFANTSGGYAKADQIDGDHAHAVTDLTYSPEKKGVRLIKADKNLFHMPALGMLLSGQSLDLTNITDYSDKYIQPAANIDDIGSIGTFNLALAGDHDHVSDPNFRSPNNGSSNGAYAHSNTSGAHNDNTQTFNSSHVTDKIKKVRLSLWTNVSEKFPMEKNGIGMWESTQPPVGWQFCDGTNGSPDLRDNFILPVNSGNENTTPVGTNKIDLNRTISHNAAHGHNGAYSNLEPLTVYDVHSTTNWNHNHTLNYTDLDYLPPYYALTFIMKL